MKRSAPLRRVAIRRPTPAARKKRLDSLARQVVFARDGYKCVKCGKGSNIQWAHVRSRRYVTVRWASFNSMVLCGGCHLWWHHNPIEASQWWTTTFPERANLLKLARSWRKLGDLTAMELLLEQELKALSA